MQTLNTSRPDPAPLSVDRRRESLRRVQAIAAEQDGVVSREQVRELGLSRWDVRSQENARRWRRVGHRTIVVHRAPLSERARWWHALIEAGPRAALDGVTALTAAGMTGYTTPICVSLPRGRVPPYRPVGVDVRVTAWRRDGDVMGAGIPRVRPAVAAVRGALWAASDRQGAFVVIMALQQRITTADAMTAALDAVRRHPRRALIADVLGDAANGVRAMSELDFARLCRRRGLPAPSRQVVRRGQRARIYLDAYWDQWGLVVEIEGFHHSLGLGPVDDALRQNDLTLASDAVLRIPLLGLRLLPDAFMDQVADWLRRHGCPLAKAIGA